ncbi:hypothetical protein ACFQX6_24145 [Streptosporangium lutulentum]
MQEAGPGPVAGVGGDLGGESVRPAGVSRSGWLTSPWNALSADSPKNLARRTAPAPTTATDPAAPMTAAAPSRRVPNAGSSAAPARRAPVRTRAATRLSATGIRRVIARW